MKSFLMNVYSRQQNIFSHSYIHEGDDITNTISMKFNREIRILKRVLCNVLSAIYKLNLFILAILLLFIKTVFDIWDRAQISYLPNPSARAGYDTRSIFKRSLTSLNSEFSFS